MIIPSKLKKGDEIRIIAPSCSMSILSEKIINLATKTLEGLGFKVSFGKNINKIDLLNSSSISFRVLDLHNAFSDNNIKAILSAIGGFNSNELLKYIDYELIKNNPKIFCGFSDITSLSNAILKKTNLVTYSGPNFSNFAIKKHTRYLKDYFKKCLMNDSDFIINPSQKWSNDKWYKNLDNKEVENNEGFWTINKGFAKGTIIGENLCTLNLLQGTEFMPSLKNSILFIEDDNESRAENFNRDLQSLIHLPNFNEVQGIVIGRFQKQSKINKKKLDFIIKTKKELNNIPVIGNVDFGHTNPRITFPIGGTAVLNVDKKANLKILKH